MTLPQMQALVSLAGSRMNEDMKRMAIATRAAQTEPKAFKEFVENED